MKRLDGNRTMKRLAPISVMMMLMVISVAIASDSVPTFYEYHVEKACFADQTQWLRLPGVAQLKVPEGALSRETDIGMTVSAWINADDPELTIEFSPHGTDFNVPITLTLSALITTFYSGDTVGVYYYNQEDDLWVLVDEIEINPFNMFYRIQLDHFSIYAFSKIRNGN